MIENLLRKNLKKRLGWSRRAGIEAYRLYDWQIPEYPFFIDVYADQVVVFDRTEARDLHRKDQMVEEINTALVKLFLFDAKSIIWKFRERQAGKLQYQKVAKTFERKVVKEGNRKYLVNLYDYLDTGLFLDHRPLRNLFHKSNQGRFLNLFSYTCSVGVAAALGGASTTNVDISKTYIEWGQENYQLNGLSTSRHAFFRQDVLSWLKTDKQTYDTIFLDPPSFSNSKKMESSSFDVLRDQEELVRACWDRLSQPGTLYFSNNHSKFRLSKSLLDLNPQNITKKTIPMDFHNQKTHWCYCFKKE